MHVIFEMISFLWLTLIISTDACDNVNCNFGRCSVDQHGAPYCNCLPGYTGELCLNEIRTNDEVCE